MLKTKVTEVDRPAFPVIDVHNHLGGGKATLTPERVNRYLSEMDAAGVRAVVNLDGGWGERLKETLAALDKRTPGGSSPTRSSTFRASTSRAGPIARRPGWLPASRPAPRA